MSLEAVFDYFHHYDKQAYQVVACSGNEPDDEDLAAFESTVGFRLPDEFREFTMSPLGGLYMEVREELWRRAKAYDVGPFWSFLYGLKVFGIASDIPEWLDIRVQFQEMVDAGMTGLVPFLQLEGDADCYCFDADRRIIQWSHDEPDARRVVETTFGKLLMQEIRELEARKERKMRGEDRRSYIERETDEITLLTKVVIYLERAPASLKTLLMIKDRLGLNTSIGELKKLAESAPAAIARDLTYAQAQRRCEEISAIDNCVGIRLARDESRQLPLER